MLYLLLPRDISPCVNSELQVHLDLLLLTQCNLISPIQCIFAYIRTARIQMHCFSFVRKQVSNHLLNKCCTHTTRDPSSERSKPFPLKYDMISVQGSMCAEDDVSQEHRIVVDSKHIEYERACIYDLAEVILELYNSDREGHAKRIVVLLHAKIFELIKIRETLKDVSACFLFVR